MTSDRAAQIAYFSLRVVSGLLFFQAGALIIFGWFGGMPGPGPHTAPLWSQMGLGGLLELGGGILIMLGLWTRPVAFILSGEMAVAYWQFHAPSGLWPILNHGEEAVLFCFIFFYMAANGSGEWSLDEWLRRKREKTLEAK